ncbi:MAG TPA: zinc ribbon domain-containing protein [Burkholderiales bacterium]|nr:zinc ribbon domain-containing protein [Burkholderiales bacterium]
MDKIWEVDDANTVEAHFGFFGGKVVTVNGKEAYNSRKLGPKGQIPFALPDGRAAAISVKRPFVGMPEIDLRVGESLVVETTKTPIKCAACGTVAKPYDRFCGKCGNAMPTAEDYANRKNVKVATNAILILAVLFALTGIALFFGTRGEAAPVLAKLQGMDPDSVFPKPINGRSYTVGELRKQLAWEPWGVLIVNAILAAIMLALSLWARRAALPAVLIATATYAVVIVAGAVSDPASIGKGLVVKIIIIGLLFRGIKAALALRAARA